MVLGYDGIYYPDKSSAICGGGGYYSGVSNEHKSMLDDDILQHNTYSTSKVQISKSLIGFVYVAITSLLAAIMPTTTATIVVVLSAIALAFAINGVLFFRERVRREKGSGVSIRH